LRCFSRLPAAKNWETHVKLEGIIGLGGISGGLGSLFRTRFRTLCVSKTEYCNEENLYYGWKLRKKPHLWTNDINVARKYVLSGGGESLTTLVVGIDMYKSGRGSTRIVQDFFTNCPNVTSLSIDEPRSTWLNYFSSRLKTLEVSTKDETGFYIPHTSSLRSLTLYSGFNYFYLPRLKSVIENLETLTICGGTPRGNEFKQILERCFNLKRVSIKGPIMLQNEFTRFIASYGDQLQYAYLRDMSTNQILRVASACQNARFHLQDYKYGLSVAAITAIGDRMEEITISGFYIRSDDNPEWVNAWNKCTNLRRLNISNCRLKHVEAMFATTKEHLKVLSIDIQMAMDGKVMKKIIDTCAQGTKCVEELVYTSQPFYRDTAERFFEKNRRSLTSITASEKYKDGDMKLADLLDSMLKLPALEHLVLDCSIPESTRRILEKRGVHWKRGIFAWK